MNRSDKIKLLKALANGEVTLESLKPQQFLMKVGFDSHSHFVNGKPVSEESFFSSLRSNPDYQAGKLPITVGYGRDED